MRNLFVAGLAFVISPVFGQTVKNVKGVQVERTAVVTYDLFNVDSALHSIALYYSDNGGKTFGPELKQVSGDLTRVQPGLKRKIVWDASAEAGYLVGDVIFKVIATPTGYVSSLREAQNIRAMSAGYRIEIDYCSFNGTTLNLLGSITKVYQNERTTIGKECTVLTDQKNNSYNEVGGKLGNVNVGEPAYFVGGATVPLSLTFANVNPSSIYVNLSICVGGADRVIKIKDIRVQPQ